MKAGKWFVCLFGLILLALSSQGCGKWLTKDEYKSLKEASDLNIQQSGWIDEYKKKVGTLETGVTHRDDALAQLRQENQKGQETIDAQRVVMAGLQRVIDDYTKLRKEAAPKPGELGAGIEGVTRPEGYGYEMQGDVLFDSGKHTLKDSGKTLLDRLVPRLKDYPREVRISGYTDSDPIVHSAGQYEDNMTLSLRRAWSVWKYLKEKGVSPDKMRVMGAGEYALVRGADGKENKAASRRAEILLVVPQVQLPKTEAK